MKAAQRWQAKARVRTRSEARSMRPVTSPDAGDSGGRPWRRPKLALWDGESLVFCESLLLGVILHQHASSACAACLKAKIVMSA